MTDKKQPEALRLADWVESVVGGPHAKQCAAELRRLHAENETLRAGYDAARLEIESLRKEHADELAVAYREELDKLSQRNYELRHASHAQAPAPINLNCKSEQKRLATLWGFVPAQPAPAYKDSTPELHVGDSAFESWYSSYNPTHKGDKQRARDAYAAGMGDSLVMAAPAAVAGESDVVSIQRQAFIRGWDKRGMAHQLKGTVETDERMRALMDIYFPRTAAPTTQPAPQQEAGKAVHQFRKQYCADWYDGRADHGDSGGPYEERTLYTVPQPAAQGDALDAAQRTNHAD